MKTHCMIDLETLGNTPDTVVLSMGAVLFNQKGQTAAAEWFFNYGAQLKAKRSVDAYTLQWWTKQGDAFPGLLSTCMARGRMAKDVFTDFRAWLDKNAGPNQAELIVWSKGANFDVPIVENMMGLVGVQVPWKFWNVRCYRTLHTIWGLQEKPNAKKHDALSDAITQATAVREFLEANPGADK